MRETIAELAAGPERGVRRAELARARLGRGAERPRTPALQWNLFGPTASTWSKPGRSRPASARRAAAARSWRCSTAAWHTSAAGATGARRTCAARRSCIPGTSSSATRHPNDVYGHGTHVAGTIAQTTNNGIGTAGIAYNAKIMPLRVLDCAARATRRDRASDPLRRALSGRRDQPLTRVPARGARGRDPGRRERAGHAHRRGVTRGGRRREPDGPRGRVPGARAVGDRGGRDHDHGLPGGLLEQLARTWT